MVRPVNLQAQDRFIKDYRALGPTKTAKKYGMARRNAQLRARAIEKRLGITLTPPPTVGNPTQFTPSIPEKLTVAIDNGVVIVGGDPHYWPGPAPVMHRAFVHFITQYSKDKLLRAVFMNGDILDLAALSRFPRDDWAPRPTTKNEVDAGILRLGEIEEAAGHAHKFMPWGNHDTRFDRYIAGRASELEGIKHTRLEDHFAPWQICKGVDINDGHNLIYVTHAYCGGEGATLNNVYRAGCHIITNHLHNANVRPVTLHNDRIVYGVDTGCLADIYAPQFGYLNGKPRNWRSAFCILTIKNSKLLQPELVLGWDQEHVQFRGEIIKV